MAGLYIKELLLREDVKRCMIVAPGGLVEQWQDELYLKFGLAFEILTPQFSELTPTGPGRKYGVEVLNKSAIVLLCAVWEAYCEDLASEAVEHLVTHAKDASALPKALRKQIAQELKADSHELAVWKLAGQDWRPLGKTCFQRRR